MVIVMSTTHFPANKSSGIYCRFRGFYVRCRSITACWPWNARSI